MRVIIIADFAVSSGGAQAVAIQSALALRARSIPVTYIYGIGGTHDARLDAAGVEMVGLGLPDIWDRSAASAAMNGIWGRDAAQRMAAALKPRCGGPAILHLHQWTRSLSPAVLPVLFESGLPLVVTLHDYLAACPNGLYYRFDLDRPCALTPLSAACLIAPCDPQSGRHKVVRVLRTWATRQALSGRAFDVIHVSDRSQETLSGLLPSAVRQHRIDNPVEATIGEPADMPADGQIAYIGRLTREKGADLVAAAADTLGQPALFIGTGPAEGDILRLHPAAHMLGWRSRADIDEILRTRVRALVAPSRWYETGPLTVYEALAAGVPVIASNRSGAAEKVVDGETGLVIEPDIPSLVAAIRRLDDIGLARRLGREAHRRYWRAPPTADAHTEHLLALYADMLAPAAA